jgi:hypothetical protein
MAPINMPAPNPDKRLNCGSCKWLYAGHEGKTCAVLRQVEAATPACIEWSKYMPSPFHAIEQDKYIKQLEASMVALSESFLKQKSKELDGYKLYKKEEFNDKDPRSYISDDTMLLLSHRFELCQAYMERVVELRNELGETLGSLKSLRKDANAYLFSQYNEQIRSLKNDSERDTFARNAFPKLARAIDQIETVIEKAILISTNLKDTHFSMARAQDGAIAIWNTKLQSMDSGRRSKA